MTEEEDDLLQYYKPILPQLPRNTTHQYALIVGPLLQKLSMVQRTRNHLLRSFLPQQTMAAYPHCAARNLHRVDLILFDVVVDRATIDVHELPCLRHTH